jgi:hypothetical protein
MASQIQRIIFRHDHDYISVIQLLSMLTKNLHLLLKLRIRFRR